MPAQDRATPLNPALPKGGLIESVATMQPFMGTASAVTADMKKQPFVAKISRGGSRAHRKKTGNKHLSDSIRACPKAGRSRCMTAMRGESGLPASAAIAYNAARFRTRNRKAFHARPYRGNRQEKFRASRTPRDVRVFRFMSAGSFSAKRLRPHVLSIQFDAPLVVIESPRGESGAAG